tara:strand:+ start:240 stop:635 length:396 start_codon:yes stop_codon:yes gene_type:complete
MEYSMSPVIMTVILLTAAASMITIVILMFMLFVSRKNLSVTEDKLIQVVMDIHEQSRFYHNAGRSSAEHQLQIERMNIEKIQAEAEKAKYEAHKMEEERMVRNQVGGFKEPKHGNKGHKRTVIESVGGVNG